MPRGSLLRAIAVGVVLSVIGVVIALAIDWFPVQASTAAEDIDLLWDVLLIVSVPIFILVMAVAVYSVVRFRVRPGDTGDGEPIHGNTRLEVVWVAIPFVIVALLSVYGWIVLDDIEAKDPQAMVVNVTGQQFAWRFQYPQAGGPPIESNDLVLPLGRQVEFNIRASDVIHSFWVPAFRMKQDAVPGIVTATRVTPTKAGSFPLVCAELCGIGHSTMRQTVRVVPEGQFTAWVGRQRQGLAGAPGDELAAGRELFRQQGCAGCHTLAEAGAQAATGPPLDGLTEVAEKRNPRQSLEEYIRDSIVAPKALVVRGYSPEGMPANYGERLSEQEIDTLVRYLASASASSTGDPPR
ncbi:MAG: cytochrome c oxidase subunit II [Thermoleophilaceae bacterium]|nr:cytochrome c oxidase subunit II [Thermoleophilaceae bacterium]